MHRKQRNVCDEIGPENKVPSRVVAIAHLFVVSVGIRLAVCSTEL